MAGAPAAAARKQLPERLREKLREQNEARRQVYNPYAPLEAPPDEYDAERRMMDEILRGAGGLRLRRPHQRHHRETSWARWLRDCASSKKMS